MEDAACVTDRCHRSGETRGCETCVLAYFLSSAGKGAEPPHLALDQTTCPLAAPPSISDAIRRVQGNHHFIYDALGINPAGKDGMILLFSDGAGIFQPDPKHLHLWPS